CLQRVRQLFVPRQGFRKLRLTVGNRFLTVVDILLLVLQLFHERLEACQSFANELLGSRQRRARQSCLPGNFKSKGASRLTNLQLVERQEIFTVEKHSRIPQSTDVACVYFQVIIVRGGKPPYPLLHQFL